MINPMRTVIYARYSTDRQGENSIEGQTAVCRELADREGWTVVQTFEDRAMSGADPRRSGYNALLEAGRAGRYDLIVVEEVSRLWRAQGEQWRCVEELEMLGLHVVGVRDGVDTRRDGFELLLAVQGAMNARARKEAAWRTHRGQTTAVANGKHAGGIAYGYRSVVTGTNARGEPDGYRLVIDDDRARWVRHIHERYAAGASVQKIVHELNAQGVPSPRGSSWAVSAIYGSPAKGTGILNNELYTGRYIWNRSKWIKDPRTGKRRRVERPAAEWRVMEREDLRIVPADTWQAVRRRMGTPSLQGGSRGRGGKPTSLFGGLMKCGICGGAVIAISQYVYGCAARKDRGPTICAGLHVKRVTTDQRLLSTLRDELASPAAIADLRAELRRLQQTQDDPAARLGQLDREIRNLAEAIAASGYIPELRQRLAAATEQRDQLRRTPPAADIDHLVAAYRQSLLDLPTVLARDIGEARTALKEVLGEIRLIPEEKEVWAKLTTRPDRLLLAAGAGVSGSGSGGLITHPEYRVRVR